MPEVAPYGSWASPITVELLTASTVGLGAPDLAADGVYWVESRPHEAGRAVLVFCPHDGEPVDVVREGFNVRTRVHEYGGGAYWRHGSTVFVSSFDDGRVFRVDQPGAEPVAVTPDPPEPNALRYADGDVTPDGRLVVCVRERHERGEVHNELVAFPVDGSGDPAVIASGHDFYAAPRVSPGGDELAWITWDHPRMPFDGTELWVAPLVDGALGDERRVAGGEAESVLDPSWSPEGVLHYVSDRTGWWNLYSVDRGELCPAEAEFAEPPWVFGRRRYAFLRDGRIACAVTRNAEDSLELLDPRSGELHALELGYTAHDSGLSARGMRLISVAASVTSPSAVVVVDTVSGASSELVCTTAAEVDARFLSHGEPIEFPGAEGRPTYGFYYPPRNPDYTAPEGEAPPLLVMVHGGPTAHRTSALDLGKQFYLSRGIAVVEVNYGGSTGYGREYRRRLERRWGVVDVEDCIAAARYLIDRGDVDPDRIAITGGSAGGYTTLLALATRDEFSAGISAFGVADLELLFSDTHKFELHYDSSLIGPLPEARELWRERSPINHADGISAPLLLHQGLDDNVVPPSQAEAIVAALERRGVPYAYLAYEGEGHGFRRADSQRRLLEANLSFLGQVFGFEPADDVEHVRVENFQRVAH